MPADSEKNESDPDIQGLCLPIPISSQAASLAASALLPSGHSLVGLHSTLVGRDSTFTSILS